MQLPSNAALLRVGAARWLPSLVLAWGAAAVLFAALRTPTHFFGLRVLLGLAEAGVFPGMWYVLSRFYAPGDMSVAYTRVTLGTVLAQALGEGGLGGREREREREEICVWGDQ